MFGFIIKKIKKYKIPGYALASTVEQTAVLGSVGDTVLNSFGIKEIDLNKMYSYKVRCEIHKAIFDRFGDYPLFYFGYKQIEGMSGPFLKIRNRLHSFVEKNQKFLYSKKYQTRLEWLDKYMKQHVSSTTLMLTTAIGDDFFCNTTKRLSDNVYEYVFTHPTEIYSEAYNRGAGSYWLVNYLSKFWDFSFKLDQEKTVEGDGWTKFVWHLEFKPKENEKRSLTKIVSDYNQEARDKLFKCVIDDNDKQRDQIENLLKQLSKYTPPQIHDALFAGKYDTEIKTQRRKLTVFFSDIKNFTSTSENLQPEDLTKYLNEYFSEMTKIALNHGATIDKYIGDAMMVFFGDPETKGEREDARACVEMALKMQERMGELREKWLNEGFADPFEVRIGINTGYCNVGNFGSDQRLTYTIIGGEVNVAARLESAADANGILMSYETYAHVQDMVEVEQKEAIKMKGINREIKIYAVEGRKEVVKTKAKVTKAKKPTKKELTEIEKLKEESKKLRRELKVIREELIV